MRNKMIIIWLLNWVREWEVYQKPNFFPLRHSDDHDFFSCWVVVVIRYFNYLTFFVLEKACMIWRITQSKEGVIQRCRTSMWMTPTDICISVCIFASLFKAYVYSLFSIAYLDILNFSLIAEQKINNTVYLFLFFKNRSCYQVEWF